MNIFQTKKQIIESNILFSFKGEPNFDNSQFVLQEIDSLTENKKHKRHLLFILSELIRPITKFVDLIKNIKQKSFTIKYSISNNIEYLYYSTEIETENAKKIDKRVQELNKLSHNALKNEYKSAILNSQWNEKHPIIGLYDIKRRSKNNIIFNTTDLKNNFSKIEMIIQFCDLSEI